MGAILVSGRRASRRRWRHLKRRSRPFWRHALAEEVPTAALFAPWAPLCGAWAALFTTAGASASAVVRAFCDTGAPSRGDARAFRATGLAFCDSAAPFRGACGGFCGDGGAGSGDSGTFDGKGGAGWGQGAVVQGCAATHGACRRGNSDAAGTNPFGGWRQSLHPVTRTDERHGPTEVRRSTEHFRLPKRLAGTHGRGDKPCGSTTCACGPGKALGR